MWFVSAALAAPSMPTYTPLPRAEPPGVCLSTVPSAGRLPRASRDAFAAAAVSLSNASADPASLTRWWDQFRPAIAGLPAHPALDGISATVGHLLSQPDAAPALAALSDAWPKDPCLATSAASAAFLAGDADGARTFVGRAWIPLPSADLAYISAELAQATGEPDRVTSLLLRGLELDPDHEGLRRLRARLALESGAAATEDLAFLSQRGDTSLEPVLMMTHFDEARLDDYLRLAVKVAGPLGVAPDLAAAPSPMVALREALGLSSPSDSLRVVLDTSEGVIPCTLFVDDAPYTVAMFIGFATGAQPWTDPRTGAPGEGPLYTDIAFHRVIPGFMIQGGDPLETGTGGPGFKFHDETRPNVRFDRPGRLAMANAGPGTNGSQFFVTQAPTSHLDGRHTIFGQCDAEGVVAAITNVPRDSHDAPKIPVVLRGVRVLDGP